MDILITLGAIVLVLGLLAIFNPIYFIRPTHRGLIERFGKYNRYATSGMTVVIPFVERLVKVNITEKMSNAEPQEIITSDNLNAKVSAQVYHQVGDSEQNVKASQYNVNDYETQIIALARTTLRNIIGTMSLKDANSQRNKINGELREALEKETSGWGIKIVRTELKEIDPPADVQETMNKVVKAANEKIAAVDMATAAETQADGLKRSKIKEAEGNRQSSILRAEGNKQSAILEAEGQAKAFDLINASFTGNAQVLKKLETVQASLSNNSKIVVPANTELINVIGDMAGLPIVKSK